jgi:hypothetical protein
MAIFAELIVTIFSKTQSIFCFDHKERLLRFQIAVAKATNSLVVVKAPHS